VILVDTSVWIRHLRDNDDALGDLLSRRKVLMHPMIVGEMACGSLRNRGGILDGMRTMPAAPVVSDDEALVLIESSQLMGRGIGYVDVHLLASAILARAPFWTADLRLARAAADLSISWSP